MYEPKLVHVFLKYQLRDLPQNEFYLMFIEFYVI